MPRAAKLPEAEDRLSSRRNSPQNDSALLNSVHSLLPPLPPLTFAEAPPPPARRTRGSRYSHRRGSSTEELTTDAPTEAPASPGPRQQENRSKRRRGSRGGRKHRRAAPASQAAVPEPAVAETETAAGRDDQRRRRSRTNDAGSSAPTPAADGNRRTGGKRSAEPSASRVEEVARAPRRARQQETAAARQVTGTVAPPTSPLRRRARIPVTGAPTEDVPAPFAHNAEYEFARILDFYGIDWQYEPRTFPLRWARGHVSEAFSPDFYLPDLNLYVELTTLKPGLTAEKNRKMRLLKELYPEVNVIMLKKQDYLRLLAKYGYGPLSPGQVPDIDRVLITAHKLQQRVAELGAQISRDYAGKEPVLVGVLRGVICFIADLVRHVSVPTAVDLMAISSYDGNGSAAVRILKDLDENIKGRDVILVEDIVDTGMTLNHIIEYLNTKRPASIVVCTLLDKRARRIANVPLEYVGFEIPDEFVVGYGLDFQQRFRNLPFVAVLKHELLP